MSPWGCFRSVALLHASTPAEREDPHPLAAPNAEDSKANLVPPTSLGSGPRLPEACYGGLCLPEACIRRRVLPVPPVPASTQQESNSLALPTEDTLACTQLEAGKADPVAACCAARTLVCNTNRFVFSPIVTSLATVKPPVGIHNVMMAMQAPFFCASKNPLSEEVGPTLELCHPQDVLFGLPLVTPRTCSPPGGLGTPPMPQTASIASPSELNGSTRVPAPGSIASSQAPTHASVPRGRTPNSKAPSSWSMTDEEVLFVLSSFVSG